MEKNGKGKGNEYYYDDGKIKTMESKKIYLKKIYSRKLSYIKYYN